MEGIYLDLVLPKQPRLLLPLQELLQQEEPQQEEAQPQQEELQQQLEVPKGHQLLKKSQG